MENALTLRVATPQDAPALLEIYTPYVRNTAITFELEVPSVEEFASRIATTLEKYPYIVAVYKGAVCAYAYADTFKGRAAYDHSVEMSIYVSTSARQNGIGSRLYAALEELLLLQNVYNLYACIAVPLCENDPYLTNGSVLFHEKRGYELVGRFPGCAYKFNRWYDMVWMQKLQGGQKERLDCFQKNNGEGSGAVSGAVSGASSEEVFEEVPPFIPFSQLEPNLVQEILQKRSASV